jgi:integrase
VVFAALEPIWDKTPETASRLRGRIEVVIDSARGPGDERRNPAAWSGWLKMKLGAPPDIKLDRKTGERVAQGHHAATDWRDVPAFVAKLAAMDTTAARALEFLILTASRTSEVIDMPWDEVGDLDAPQPTWIVPKARMKMKRDHLVPFSPRAVDILRERLAQRSTGSFGPHPFVFEGDRPRRGLSQMSLLMLLRRMKVDCTGHGFRSSFRTWCADKGVALEVAESALAHAPFNAIIQAYQRSSTLERRRPVMTAWADFVTGKTKPSEVVPIRQAVE